MGLSKNEATRALADVKEARAWAASLRYYRYFAPHMIVWGCIWLVANGLTSLVPPAGGKIWGSLVVVGSLVSTWLGIRARKEGASDEDGPHQALRYGSFVAALLAYFGATFAMLPPLSGLQTNAFISLFVALAYVLVGIWSGWKISAVGASVAVLTLVGYFLLPAYYALWMGAVTGSALILGGVWLRRAWP